MEKLLSGLGSETKQGDRKCSPSMALEQDTIPCLSGKAIQVSIPGPPRELGQG